MWETIRSARAWLGGELEALLDALYPPRCWLCGVPAPDGLACAAHSPPERPSGPRCGRCARALPPAFPDGGTCAHCRREPPRYARLVALWDWRESPVARDWVLALKHGGRRDLAEPLALLLGERVREVLGNDVLCVPVPLHPLRRLERGYDQAFLLARALAFALGHAAGPALERLRPTPVQGALGSPARSSNVQQAFAVDPAHRRRIARARVLLVDDVATSDSTLGACARTLRRAGAARVDAAVLARAG